MSTVFWFWFLIWFGLQRPQLVKGNMQLFSIDQQRSQALEAHAASFAQFKVWFPFPNPFSTFHAHSWFLFCFVFLVQISLKEGNRHKCIQSFMDVGKFGCSYRFQEMRILLFLFPLPQRPSMLGRLHQSYMLLSLVPSQVNLRTFVYDFFFLLL